jgi:hypothetical protein
MERVLLILLCVFVGLGIAGLLDRATPRSEITGEAIHPAVRQGGTFEALFRLTVERDCTGVVNSTLTSDVSDWQSSVDEWIIRAGSRSGGQAGVRRTIAIPPVTIPPSAPVGPATLHTETMFYCNPMHNLWPLRVSYPPVKFTIEAATQ